MLAPKPSRLVKAPLFVTKQGGSEVWDPYAEVVRWLRTVIAREHASTAAELTPLKE